MRSTIFVEVALAQHFLLSAAARTLSLKAVLRMSDKEAFDTFKKVRWVETDGEPFCPHCGGAVVYELSETPVRWKCKACRKKFSITSGTLFASRKLPIREYLACIALFVNGVKGTSSLQISRDLDINPKSAFVLLHKLRAAMGSQVAQGPIGGEVEVDGGHFGGHVRPANFKENRRDRRLAENQTGKRRVVIIMRERNGRSLPFVVRTEAASVETVASKIEPGSVIHADEASHWDALHGRFDTRRINHSQSYSDGNACTNWAESYFARLRRLEIGQHHHIAGPHLAAYANEAAWREDHRRVSNGEQYLMIAGAALRSPVSKTWAGYWHRSAE
jgi:transposase-like protein